MPREQGIHEPQFRLSRSVILFQSAVILKLSGRSYSSQWPMPANGHALNRFSKYRNVDVLVATDDLRRRRGLQHDQRKRNIQETQLPLKMYNGTFYTMDKSNPWAQAAFVDAEGKFRVVGTLLEVDNYLSTVDTSFEEQDLIGQLVLPEFQDVHLHAVEAGLFDQLCYVPEDTFISDVPGVLDRCPDGAFIDSGWIVGAGYDIGLLLEQLSSEYYLDTYRYVPTPLQVLDQSYPTKPVLIIDNLGHGVLCNTEALIRVGYESLTADPPGGKVLRDDNGPWGVVLENAQQPLREAAFPDNGDLAYESLLDSMFVLNANGITSVSDAGGFWRQKGQVESWSRAQNNELLRVRASNALYVYPDMTMDEQLPQLLNRYVNHNNPVDKTLCDLPTEMLRFNQAKIYVDGILSLTTGALKEPYLYTLDLPPEEELGFEYFGDSDRLQNVSRTLVENGFQLHFHAVGDRGVALALDAIAALPTNGNSTGPHRVTHCYLIDEVDRTRFAQLGVIADFQLSPSSLTTKYSGFLSNDLIGRERAAQLLPAKEVHETGAMLTLSSDWDADVLSPLVKMQSVLTRSDGRSFSDLETVMPMMNLNAAKLLQQEEITGSLEVGKYADLVVLDKNIFGLPVEEISTALVSLTMLQGEVVFDASIDERPTPHSPSHASLQQVTTTITYILVCTVAVLFTIA
jgi:predicted amidohydrolase YtcJ